MQLLARDLLHLKQIVFSDLAEFAPVGILLRQGPPAAAAVAAAVAVDELPYGVSVHPASDPLPAVAADNAAAGGVLLRRGGEQEFFLGPR